MLDGIWWVYKPDGTYLGLCETRMGNEILIVPQGLLDTIHEGDTLHMDECYSQKAWEVLVGNVREGHQNEFYISKLSDRPARYATRKITLSIRTVC